MKLPTILLLFLTVSRLFAQDAPSSNGNHPGFHEAAIAFGYGAATDMRSLAEAVTADWKGKSKAAVEKHIDDVIEKRDKQQLGAMRHPGSATLTFYAPGKGISTFSVTFNFDTDGLVSTATGTSTGH